MLVLISYRFPVNPESRETFRKLCSLRRKPVSLKCVPVLQPNAPEPSLLTHRLGLLGTGHQSLQRNISEEKEHRLSFQIIEKSPILLRTLMLMQ